MRLASPDCSYIKDRCSKRTAIRENTQAGRHETSFEHKRHQVGTPCDYVEKERERQPYYTYATHRFDNLGLWPTAVVRSCQSQLSTGTASEGKEGDHEPASTSNTLAGSEALALMPHTQSIGNQ